MMRETLLSKYLAGELPANVLKENLNNLHDVLELQIGSNFHCDLDSSQEVTLLDLIKICEDYLRGFFDAKDVETTSFLLIGSDHFIWDSGTRDGAIIAELLDDWSSPDTAFPINRRNMKMILRGLGEGVYDTRHLGASQL